MANVPLGRSDYFRNVAKEARIRTRNRFFEQNPVLNETQAALIARPGMRRWLSVGPGPIRGIYSQPGSFGDALFVVSGDQWWRVNPDGTRLLLKDDMSASIAPVTMAATGALGDTPEYMFMSDGVILYVYEQGLPVGQVTTPDDVGVIGLGYIASHVVVVPAQGQGINGRFFWIEPGEKTIDPLNFATAERAPDPIYGVVVFGDQFWLPGQSTTEVWYFTGNPEAPVLRLQGVTFDRGTWEGTAVQVKESMVIVDSDGGVFQISGGLKRISRPDIEERIRKAIAFQSSRTS